MNLHQNDYCTAIQEVSKQVESADLPIHRAREPEPVPIDKGYSSAVFLAMQEGSMCSMAQSPKRDTSLDLAVQNLKLNALLNLTGIVSERWNLMLKYPAPDELSGAVAK